MSLTLVTPPAVEPLSLEEAKSHLRVNFNDDDAIIQLYIQAARSYVDGEDGFLGRCLVTQTWLLTLDAFPTDEIKIPLPPLQSIASITYDDPAGVSQTVSVDDYYVDVAKEPGWVVPINSWPTPIDAINAVRILFTAGYEPGLDSPSDLTGNIPASIKAGMLLMIGSWYDQREDLVVGTIVQKLPFGSENLFRPFRVQLGMA